MSIKRINIIDNNMEDSIKVRNQIKELIIKHNLIEDNENPDLIIAIGGDGAFIKALRENSFNTKALYVGILTGHLGFLQDVEVDEIDELFYIITNDKYKVETLSVEEIKVFTKDGIIEHLALNEVVLREIDCKTIKFDIKINDKHFEYFAGDGVVISTPTGSTAHNLSAGGSIIYPSLKTLQILPLAPLPMSKHFSTLRSSAIVPEDMTICLIPEDYYKDKIQLKIDGETFISNEIEKIEITTAKEGINVLRFNNYDFWERVNKKFLTFK